MTTTDHRAEEEPDADLAAVEAIRQASWDVARRANGSRPDPLPGLPEARDMLRSLQAIGWAVVRDAEVERLRRLAIWLIRLDQPDGIDERRTATLTKIIDRARQALESPTLHRLEDVADERLALDKANAEIERLQDALIEERQTCWLAHPEGVTDE